MGIELDLGSSGEFAETEENNNQHRQVVKVGGISACRLRKTKAAAQAVTCQVANTDYAVANALAQATKYLAVYCEADFVVAMGEPTSASCGIGLSAGAWTIPVTYTGVAADDRLHVQSVAPGVVVRVTEMED